MPFPLFDIFTYVRNALPPNYRLPKWIAAFQGYLSGLDWNMSRFIRFKNGDSQALWNNATTYSVGDRVQFQYSIWESQISSNVGNQPTTSPVAWILYNKSAIGATERAKYNGRTMNLTYELNKYFQQELEENGFSGFIDGLWPAPYDYGLGGGVWSDIYLTTNPIVYLSFVGYKSPQIANIMYENGHGNAFMFQSTYTATESSYKYTIHIPALVYAAIDTTPAIADTIIRKFVDQYNVVGLQYQIIAY